MAKAILLHVEGYSTTSQLTAGVSTAIANQQQPSWRYFMMMVCAWPSPVQWFNTEMMVDSDI